MSERLELPALRGVMGDWAFYSTLLPFKEIAERIKRNDEIHSSKQLQDWLQRVLTDRSKLIADYLESQPQHFFNSIVVAVYGGEPKWLPAAIEKSDFFDPEELTEEIADTLGVLILNGNEKLFALDGQHRVEGVKTLQRRIGKKAFDDLPDQVSAIFVAHHRTPTGMQRSRRLFSTLNRTAKPVSLTELIIIDEDDIIAIVCRYLMETHRLFSGAKISRQKQKQIGASDKTSFTSVVALYQSMDIYLSDGRKEAWIKFKTVRPPEDAVTTFKTRATKFWDSLVKLIPELKIVSKLGDNEPLPRRFRGPHGGDLLFRPITPPMLARCLRSAKKLGLAESRFLKRFAKIPRDLNGPPWKNTLWDGNMITRAKNKRVAENLILWMVNADPSEKKIREDKLLDEIASLLGRDAEEVSLPRKVRG